MREQILPFADWNGTALSHGRDQEPGGQQQHNKQGAHAAADHAHLLMQPDCHRSFRRATQLKGFIPDTGIDSQPIR